MKKNIKVLITAAGSTNGVNVIKALKDQKELFFSIIAADTNPLATGFHMVDKYYVVPKVDALEFIPTILKICKKEKIEIIIPTFSDEFTIFAKNKEIFDKQAIKMAISSYETYLMTENKIKTSEYFQKWEIPSPKLYTEEEIKSKKIKFPVIIKPIKASGSKGVTKINNWEELNFFKNYLKKSIIQEYVKGDEYTIDGLCDLKGKMIAASPRIRLETKGGLAVKSITVKNSLMVGFTKKIVENFKIIGPFNVQCFKNKNDIKFIEVNTRFPSGGLPLTVKAGLNIPLILIQLLLGEKIKKSKIKTDIVITRYWDSIILKKENNHYKLIL